MSKRFVEIDPVTRISGLLSVKVQIENGVITNAMSSGMQIRGFEKMLQGRSPLDAIWLTARTCGICSLAHTLASSMALEMAFGIEPDFNGELIRTLANGFETLQNNIRHFYQFVIPDYVDISGISPLQVDRTKEEMDYRLPKEINDQLASHYKISIAISRSAHKAEAVIAGKAPHNHGVFAGGTTTDFTIVSYNEVKSILAEIKRFVTDIMIPDLEILMRYYPEYKEWGSSLGNYLSYGYSAYLPEELRVAVPGAVIKEIWYPLDKNQISESIQYSWFQSEKTVLRPLDEPPEIDFQKPKAYSWVDAPRYAGYPMETGPLAELMVGGQFFKQTGALYRNQARCLFTNQVCQQMERILEQVAIKPAFQEKWQVPKTGEGYALVGAPRGGLGHWIRIENQKISRYSLLPPSNWNMSPMCENHLHGPCEQALIGTPIPDEKKAKSIIGRIVRSFDPCLNCAAHVLSDKAEPFCFQIL